MIVSSFHRCTGLLCTCCFLTAMLCPGMFWGSCSCASGGSACCCASHPTAHISPCCRAATAVAACCQQAQAGSRCTCCGTKQQSIQAARANQTVLAAQCQCTIRTLLRVPFVPPLLDRVAPERTTQWVTPYAPLAAELTSSTSDSHVYSSAEHPTTHAFGAALRIELCSLTT